jgi:hypothetical protein
MANNFLFGLVAFVFLYYIIVFVVHYMRAGSTIVTLERPQGNNVLFLGGFLGGVILIAVVIWTTVSGHPSDKSIWERPALFLLGIHLVMRYMLKPRLSARGIFWDGQLIPWDNVLSVVWSPNDKKNVLVQYASSAKASPNVKLLTVGVTPQVAQAIAQKVPGAKGL